MPRVVACKWSPAENTALEKAVVAHGGKGWDAISASLTGRNAKQCCDRWRNQLDPSINHAAFSPKEDAAIIQLTMGATKTVKWAAMRDQLPGFSEVCYRTANQVKNRWYNKLCTRPAKKARIEQIEPVMRARGCGCHVPPSREGRRTCQNAPCMAAAAEARQQLDQQPVSVACKGSLCNKKPKPVSGRKCTDGKYRCRPCENARAHV